MVAWRCTKSTTKLHKMQCIQVHRGMEWHRKAIEVYVNLFKQLVVFFLLVVSSKRLHLFDTSVQLFTLLFTLLFIWTHMRSWYTIVYTFIYSWWLFDNSSKNIQQWLYGKKIGTEEIAKIEFIFDLVCCGAIEIFIN